MQPLTGYLLISNSNLFDPNFRRTVLLVGHHDDDGAVGVVLNQPLGVTVREAVPPLGDLVDPEDLLVDGGLVEPASSVLGAGLPRSFEGRSAGDGHDRLQPPEADDDIGARSSSRARVYAGYAGWGFGQLEDGARRGEW